MNKHMENAIRAAPPVTKTYGRKKAAKLAGPSTKPTGAPAKKAAVARKKSAAPAKKVPTQRAVAAAKKAAAVPAPKKTFSRAKKSTKATQAAKDAPPQEPEPQVELDENDIRRRLRRCKPRIIA